MVLTRHNLKAFLAKTGEVVARKKTEDDEEEDGSRTKLARVLGLFDLTLLGVGSTLGVGVYVLAGAVARQDAGPAVTLSFLVAAIASAFAGLCYAEFAARVPKAGSAYVYSYVTVGELAAFIIGWNLILEYVIGTASVARAFSNYVDTLVDYKMSKALQSILPMKVEFLSPYPDFLSFGIVLLLTALLAWGARESAWMNNIFTAVNLLTVLIVIVAGCFRLDFANWTIPKDSLPEGEGGEGGFLPFGIAGVMAGAAKCFFGFVGFDCVATTGEEAKNPQKHIPLAIILSLIIIFLAYFGISSVLTLMWPYYKQDINAPLVYVFGQMDMNVIKIIVSAGAIFALCTSLFGCSFPMPRILYAMSNDGILPKVFGKIFKSTQTPLISTIISGILAGIMAALFKLEQLIDMMSIGTLLAYTIVALCVLLLRYRNSKKEGYVETEVSDYSFRQFFGQIINVGRLKQPDKLTTFVSELSTAIFVVFTIASTFLMVFCEKELTEGTSWTIVLLVILLVCTLLPVLIISLQPQDNPTLFFKVPGLPFIPAASIFMNIYLMMKLDVQTWIRFSVWLAIGAVIYIGYSISHSVEGAKKRKQDLNKK